MSYRKIALYIDRWDITKRVLAMVLSLTTLPSMGSRSSNPSQKQKFMPQKRFMSPIYLLYMLAVSIFAAEMFVMFIISFLPTMSTLVESVIDSISLVILISPTLYFFLLRPLIQHITERKQAEEVLKKTAEKLTHTNADLQQFAYIASHDLKEPLRMVGSYVQLLAQRYQGQLDKDADDFIGYSLDGITRMQKLIDDLLKYSRVGTQGKPFTPTDCSAVLESTLLDLKIAIEENNAVVKYNTLPVVMADDIQLGQLFLNLINNAIKFRNDKLPEIYIGAEHRNGQWQFSVRDNGIGIDPQFKERIFVIFQRLHTRDEYSGTGIGLAVCKKIVERHGGRIWVESKLGEGTTFYFTLPDVETRNIISRTKEII